MNTNNANSRFAAESHVAAPLGKQVVRGVIVGTRATEGEYGWSYKMTVKVSTPEGSWLVWSTVPAAIFDQANDKVQNVNGLIDDIKGCEVQFTATLEPGRDAHFVFAKRPTKAALLTVPAGKERTSYRPGDPIAAE